VKAMCDAAVKMAQGAALITNTEIDTIQTVGSAWSGHFNKTIAEVTYENIKRVGLPEWDEDDIARDYFVARTSTDSLIWIYRERAGGGWYLHGLFA